MIIENHGEQHYIDGTRWGVGRILKEEQENDLFKYNLAINNGVVNYVVLDCRNSNKEWIKNSIINSMLPTILYFKEEDIDWDKALLYASTSLIKTSAKLFNEGCRVLEISKIINRHRSTVWHWLNIATQLGLCNYHPENETSLVNSKKIKCVETNIIFKSISEAAKSIEQSSTSIVNCLKGKTHTAGGYHWEYV